MNRPLALLLDADATSRSSIEGALRAADVDVRIASSPGEAIALLSREPVSLLFFDRTAFAKEAEDVLLAARRARASVVPIAVVDDEIGVGAAFFSVLTRPLARPRLDRAVELARMQHDLLAEIGRLRDESRSWSRSSRIYGRSDAIESLVERLGRLAPVEDNVLFTGEPGTGKELAAQVVHELSPRRRGAFVRVECSGVAADDLEADLFGGGEGAGALFRADGGVLYLHEVADLAFPLQERVARFLGAGTEAAGEAVGFIRPDVRVLTGTTRDLGRAVSDGRFHDDLYRRLAVEVVVMPPLRERRGDPAHLARRFLETICDLNDIPLLEVPAETRVRLERYSWPGNVPELRRAIERAALLAAEGRILPENLPEAVRDAGEAGRESPAPATDRFRNAKRIVVEEFEKAYLHALMQRRGGNVTAAAEEAGMLRSALQRLLRKYDLRSAAYRTPRATPSRTSAL